MNTTSMGEIILNCRKKKSITQQQLADQIGVSSGAVSKWENGSSLPDIAILKPLARALGITIDTLLSFELALSDSEVANIKKELTELFLHKGFDEGFQACKAYMLEYPNSIVLKLNTAHLIQMYIGTQEKATDSFAENILQHSLSIYEEVAASGNQKYANLALFSIASIQMALEHFDESEKALQALSENFVDPYSLWPALLLRQGKLDEAELICKQCMLRNLSNLSNILTVLSRVEDNRGSYQKSAFYLEALDDLESKFEFGLTSAQYSLARLSLKQNLPKKAATFFLSYVQEIIVAPYDYTGNPYLDGIVLQLEPKNQIIVRKSLYRSLLNDEKELAQLEEYSDYQKAKHLLEKAISE